MGLQHDPETKGEGFGDIEGILAVEGFPGGDNAYSSVPKGRGGHRQSKTETVLIERDVPKGRRESAQRLLPGAASGVCGYVQSVQVIYEPDESSDQGKGFEHQCGGEQEVAVDIRRDRRHAPLRLEGGVRVAEDDKGKDMYMTFTAGVAMYADFMFGPQHSA